MIAADKRRFFNWWFAGHARARILAQFSSVRTRGLAAAQSNAAAGPTLVVCNHTSWWDPLVAIWLSNHVFRTDAYAMMDAKNLAVLPFFKRVGAFGVDLTDPADGAKALRYAAKLLASAPANLPPRMLWIYPQGAEQPITAPLLFKPGSAEIARLAKRCSVQPVAIRYEFAAEELPRLYLAFGAPLQPNRDVVAGLAQQQSAVAELLANLDEHLRIGTHEFEILTAQKPSAVAAAFTRMLAWWVR